MAENKHVKNKHATILGILGIIFVIIGAFIAIVHTPLRGSGLGTICLVIGVVLLVIAMLRYNHTK